MPRPQRSLQCLFYFLFVSLCPIFFTPRMMLSQKVRNRLFLSFPRRRESSIFGLFWTPASAGVTAMRTFYETIKIADFVKNPKTPFSVIPAKAGIQVLRSLTECLDPGFHRGDDFLRSRQDRRLRKKSSRLGKTNQPPPRTMDKVTKSPSFNR